MIRNRTRRFRPAVLDHLESRVVPSGGIAPAPVTAAAVGTTTTAASRLATLETELGAAGARVNAAFATFASQVRQVEQALIPAATGTATAPSVEAISGQVATLGNTLATAVASAYGGVAAIGSNAAVIASGLDGGGDGSLITQLQGLFRNDGASGTFDPASLPLLFASVEAVMAVGYGSTAIEGFVAGVGGSGLITPSASATAFNLATFGTQANAAYTTFGESIRGAEISLPTSTGPVEGTTVGTIAAAQTADAAAADTLATALVAAVTGTTAEPIVALRAQEEAAALAAFGPLLAIAAPTGVIPTADVQLVLADGEVAINGSYGATAIQAYLIATFTGAA